MYDKMNHDQRYPIVNLNQKMIPLNNKHEKHYSKNDSLTMIIMV